MADNSTQNVNSFNAENQGYNKENKNCGIWNTEKINDSKIDCNWRYSRRNKQIK